MIKKKLKNFIKKIIFLKKNHKKQIMKKKYNQ